MKRRTILMIFGFLFIPGFMINVAPARAIIRDQTVSTIAEKDTYVNYYDPLTNFGGVQYALAGFYSTEIIAEAYFFFPFSDKPDNYTKAEISLYCHGDSLIRNVTICLIEEDWNEYSMNWENKPEKGSEITSLLMEQTGFYNINVTDYIEGRNNLSICVYIKDENYVDDCVSINTRELANPLSPHIVWTYPENAEITITNPTGSSIWVDSKNYHIQWTSIGIIEDVKIQLFKGITFIKDITYTYTDNDGDYYFYINPLEGYNGTDYRIKIIDNDDPNVYDYSDYFSINIGSGMITITHPTSSESWLVGQTCRIRWDTTGTIIKVDIEIYKGDTLKYEVGDYSCIDHSWYDWEIDKNIETGKDWRVKVSNVDNSSQYGWSDYFEIKHLPDTAIPGYNYYMIFSFIFIISALAIRRIKK